MKSVVVDGSRAVWLVDEPMIVMDRIVVHKAESSSSASERRKTSWMKARKVVGKPAERKDSFWVGMDSKPHRM